MGIPTLTTKPVRMGLGLQAAVDDPDLRAALLPDDVPGPIRQVMTGIPTGWLSGVNELFGQEERSAMLHTLIA